MILQAGHGLYHGISDSSKSDRAKAREMSMQWKVCNTKEEFVEFRTKHNAYGNYDYPKTYPALAIVHIGSFKTTFTTNRVDIEELKTLDIIHASDFPELFFKGQLKDMLE